jgi:hypothetical protein
MLQGAAICGHAVCKVSRMKKMLKVGEFVLGKFAREHGNSIEGSRMVFLLYNY